MRSARKVIGPSQRYLAGAEQLRRQARDRAATADSVLLKRLM